MICPRCRADINARPDAAGVIVCTACKAQLKVRNPGSMPPTPAGNVTLPAGVRAPVPGPSKGPTAAPPPKPAAERPTARMAVPSKAATAAAPASIAAAAPAPALAAVPVPAAPAAPASLDDVMGELKALRGLQVEILSMLKAMASVSSTGSAPPADEPFAPASAPAVRTRRRKTVLVMDDDDQTRKAAVAALEQAEVPVRAASDGNAGLEAMAGERPDVVVLELGMAGRMAGKDVVNMIKATMEWVDIPIVLYTRIPVESQKEARLVHGADELVPKGTGAPEALVARVIALFRRG